MSAPELSIGKAAARFGLSRSTLLYYASIGVLVPSGRTEAGYRLYSAADCSRLERIVSYREAGISLKEITRILDGDSGGQIRRILEKRLVEMNAEIARLHQGRNVLIAMLKQEDPEGIDCPLNREQWVHLFQSFGFTSDDMARWHQLFEKQSPDAHREFLTALGISPDEIEEIRARSRL